MSILKVKFHWALVLCFAVAGCTKEESGPRLSQFDVPVIHGVILRDFNGSVIEELGEPNVYIGDVENDFLSSNYAMYFFPNPGRSYVSVQLLSPNLGTEKKVWIVEASLSETFVPQLDLGSINLFAGGAPLVHIELSSTNASLDISNLANGYYRIYVQMDDVLLFDNLVVNRP